MQFEAVVKAASFDTALHHELPEEHLLLIPILAFGLAVFVLEFSYVGHRLVDRFFDVLALISGLFRLLLIGAVRELYSFDKTLLKGFCDHLVVPLLIILISVLGITSTQRVFDRASPGSHQFPLRGSLFLDALCNCE